MNQSSTNRQKGEVNSEINSINLALWDNLHQFEQQMEEGMEKQSMPLPSSEIRDSERKELPHRKMKIGRKGSKDVYVGIKQIAPVVVNALRKRNTTVRGISNDVVKALGEIYPQKIISANTIQKRVYDTTLVLAGLGVLTVKKKVNYYEDNNLCFEEEQHLHPIQLQRICEMMKDHIERKKRHLMYLRTFLKDLKRLSERNKEKTATIEEEQESTMKLPIDCTFGMLLSQDQCNNLMRLYDSGNQMVLQSGNGLPCMLNSGALLFMIPSLRQPQSSLQDTAQ